MSPQLHGEMALESRLLGNDPCGRISVVGIREGAIAAASTRAESMRLIGMFHRSSIEFVLGNDCY